MRPTPGRGRGGGHPAAAGGACHGRPPCGHGAARLDPERRQRGGGRCGRRRPRDRGRPRRARTGRQGRGPRTVPRRFGTGGDGGRRSQRRSRPGRGRRRVRHRERIGGRARHQRRGPAEQRPPGGPCSHRDGPVHLRGHRAELRLGDGVQRRGTPTGRHRAARSAGGGRGHGTLERPRRPQQPPPLTPRSLGSVGRRHRHGRSAPGGVWWCRWPSRSSCSPR